MIERIRIKNFKSLREVDVKLGALNVFIGTNASGKSNFFDALRFLQGLAGGFRVIDIFNGGAKTMTGGEWKGIRGGLQNACFRHPERPQVKNVEVSFALQIPYRGGQKLNYEFAFNQECVTTRESLLIDKRNIFTCDHNGAFFHSDENGQTPCGTSLTGGSQLLIAFQMGFAGEQHKPVVEAWWKAMVRTQFLLPDPAVIGTYGGPGQVPRMGEHGEDFASIVRDMDSAKKAAFLSWLQELLPAEVDAVGTKPGAQGEPMFFIQQKGQDFLAPVLSDGTLRFAAIAAAFFQSASPGILAVEEVENGIHTSRLRLLVELFRSRAKLGQTQIIATTHAPMILAWLKPEEYETAFYFRRNEDDGATEIIPLSEIPKLKEVAQKQPISDLMAEGWLEAAL